MNDPLARLTTALADRYAIIREEPDLGGATTAEAASFAVVGTPRKLPRVNPRLGQLTVAEATNVPNVGLPTDRRAASLLVVTGAVGD